MPLNIYDHRMPDDSRNFAGLPETTFFDELREFASTLDSAEETGFLTDWVTKVWLDFDYRRHKFSISNQKADYWFFVEDPNCADEILLEVFNHFETHFNR
jgi:hypothetical protein